MVSSIVVWLAATRPREGGSQCNGLDTCRIRRCNAIDARRHCTLTLPLCYRWDILNGTKFFKNVAWPSVAWGGW